MQNYYSGKSALNLTADEKEQKCKQFIKALQLAVERNFTCAVCQSSAQYPIILKCTHLFCSNCVKSWLKLTSERGLIKTCPICRQLIPLFEDSLQSQILMPLGSFIRKVHGLSELFNRGQYRRKDDDVDDLLNLFKILGIPCKFQCLRSIYNMTWTKESSSVPSPASSHPHSRHNFKNSSDSTSDAFLEAKINVNVDSSSVSERKSFLACVDLIRQLHHFEPSWARALPRESKGFFLHALIPNLGKIYNMVFPWHDECLELFHLVLDVCSPFLFQPLVGQRRYWQWRQRQRRRRHGSWVLTSPTALFYFWVVLTLLYFCAVGTLCLTWVNSSSHSKNSVKELMKHLLFSLFDAPSYDLMSTLAEAFFIL